MTYDVQAIRAEFPALAVPDAHGSLPLFLDGPGGAQVPQPVLDAIVGYLGRYNSNLGGYADAGIRTTQVLARARAAASDLLGAPAEGIVFGLNSTSLLFNVSRAVARTWTPGDNIVVTDLDHYANVSSWSRAAGDAGVEVRTWGLDADAAALDLADLAALIDDRTRLVAVTGASNLLGTIVDVPAVVALARRVGAWVCVDAVHAAVHELVDASGWDVDFLFSSAYKLGGPHLSVCAAKPEHLRALTPYKVAPASEEIPGRWEQGTQSFEALAGFVALVDYWASLADASASPGDSRRTRLAAAYAAIAAHERDLMDAVLQGFAARPWLRLYGLAEASGRTPTFAFNVVADGEVVDAQGLVRWLGERNVALGLGNFYAVGAVRRLGVGTVLRMGLVHYSTLDEVERFFALLDEGVGRA